MTPLKSGDSAKGDWQHINRVAGGSQYARNEIIAAGHTPPRRPLRTPLGGGGGTNWNYRGLWSAAPASPYMTYDVVQVGGTGSSAGMYLSLIDSNGSAPDSGYGWVQVSASSSPWL